MQTLFHLVFIYNVSNRLCKGHQGKEDNSFQLQLPSIKSSYKNGWHRSLFHSFYSLSTIVSKITFQNKRTQGKYWQAWSNQFSIIDDQPLAGLDQLTNSPSRKTHRQTLCHGRQITGTLGPINFLYWITNLAWTN